MSRQLTPTRGYPPGINSPAMEQSLIVNENRRKIKTCIYWGAVNICLLAIVAYDIIHTSPIYIASILYTEYALAIIFSLNVLYHFIRYFIISLNTGSVAITLQQQRLLGVQHLDPNYMIVPQSPSSPAASGSTPNGSFSNTPMNTTAISWRSNMSSFNDSQNYAPSPLSFSCVRSSPPYPPAYDRQSPYIPPPNVPCYDSSGSEFISDEQTLADYLKGYEIYEKTINTSSPPQQPSSLLTSFWNHPAAKNNGEVPSFLRKSEYQHSPLSSGSSSSSPTSKSDDKMSPINNQPLGVEMWRQFHVSSVTLTQWNANIRMWLSQTIVERLVKEIEHIDDALLKQGLSDVRLGGVGLDRLRKTAQMTPVVQCIPTLSTLIPFLELSANQEYLVKRIRELGKGGCMSDFKWNGGSSYNGKEWNDSLPTDSAIIMHLFVTYMDTQLLPLPNKPDVKPFSGYHYIKSTDKMPCLTPTLLAIHQFSEKPPHYRVIAGEEIFEMVKGYNNLFHSLLLFLYQVNKREHGMLGRINLGKSGVNILWVIDS